ncbi:MAG: histidine phosphatase family protein [Lachnospiraceae bacterium]|nr:histidine phosphatase family protein [Lachnospiraceae bacterium]
MKIILIRHGDPDYAKDFLTEKGEREAACLAKWIKKKDPEVFRYYVSPLGRARETARVCLEPLGKEATVLPWIEEYTGRTMNPRKGYVRHAWDFYPGDWTKDETLFHEDTWLQSPLYDNDSCRDGFRVITEGFDALLSEYGYQREGHIYRTDWKDGQPEEKTIVIFCHMIATLSIIAHLTGIAAPLLWHGFFCAPTGLTVVETEERDPGTAWFRVRALGEVAHLLTEGEPISNSGFKKS